MLLSFASCTKQGGGNIDANPQGGEGSAFASRYSDMTELDITAVLWSENFSVSVSMFTYYFNSVYHNYVDAGTYGIDEKVSLKAQTYSGNTTWFDQLAHETSNNIQIKLFLAEEALAAGMTLPDEVYADIDKEIQVISNNAKAQNTTTEANIKIYYGDVVNEATIRKCLELNALADKFNTEKLQPKYNFKSEDYDKQFEKSPKDYLAMSYMTYIIPAETGSDEVTEQFKACKSADEMEALIRSRMATDYPKIKAEEYDERIKELYVHRQYGAQNSEFADWAYEDARKPYDVYTKTTNGITYVAMMLPALEEAYTEVLYRDRTIVHNVYAIAFLEMDYDKDAKKAHEIAQSVYDQAKGGSDIVTLCNMYGGGSMSNIMLGDAPEAVEKWIFDDARKKDELGIIKVDGVGTYVIKMRQDGGETWQYLCALDMTDEIYQADLQALNDKYNIGKNNAAVESVTEIAGERNIPTVK